jgi:hypothetical protein
MAFSLIVIREVSDMITYELQMVWLWQAESTTPGPGNGKQTVG